MLSNQTNNRIQTELHDLRRRSNGIRMKIQQLRQDELNEQESVRKKYALEVQREESVVQHLARKITELEEDLTRHQEELMKELHRTRQEVQRKNNPW